MIGDRLLRQARYELDRRRSERDEMIAKIEAEAASRRKAQVEQMLEKMREALHKKPRGQS